MQIQIDSREKEKAIKRIIATFEKRNIGFFVSKLYVGDYVSLDNPRLSIDRKQNLSELYSNLCHEHKRFVAEIVRANNAGIKLIILIEHGGRIKSLDDVKEWSNPRLKVSPYAWNGKRMHKTMLTMQNKYGIQYEFCDKRQTGDRIIELLKGL